MKYFSFKCLFFGHRRDIAKTSEIVAKVHKIDGRVVFEPRVLEIKYCSRCGEKVSEHLT
jgi:formylmethanofuran dehydrogenase subunit E